MDPTQQTPTTQNPASPVPPNPGTTAEPTTPEPGTAQTPVPTTQPQEVPPPAPIPMKPKNSPTGLIIGLVFILLVAIGAYFVYQQGYLDNLLLKPTPILTVEPTPTSTPDPTANWETYVNPDYTFRYPSKLTLRTGEWEESGQKYNLSKEDEAVLSFTEPNQPPHGGFPYGLTIMIKQPLPNSKELDLVNKIDELKLSLKEHNIQINEEETTVDGIVAYKLKYTFENNITTYIFLNNSKIYEISLYYFTPDLSSPTNDFNLSFDYEALFNQIISSFNFTEANKSINWDIYMNKVSGFSINYPTGWRTSESTNNVGFGPKEIGEDVVFGISYYNKEDKTLDQIKDEVGKQFSDRKQTEETVSFGGLTATKLTTTTTQSPDWYLVTIIIDKGNMLYAISNGAQTDKALNEMITKRTGNPSNITFEDFYTSFKLVK